MEEKKTETVAYFVWYTSDSHKKDRFYIGIGKEKFKGPIPGMILVGMKPQWSYDKGDAELFADLADAQAIKERVEGCGYKNIQIGEIKGDFKYTPKEEMAPVDPVGVVH